MNRPVCTILAGPNGSGKTTFFSTLPFSGKFVNTDIVAQSLDGDSHTQRLMAAGRLVLGELDQLIFNGQSFIYETTFSSHQSLSLVQKCKLAGFEVNLFFLALNSLNLHIKRVASRVSQGGHDIPADVIVRRYYQSFIRLERSLHLFDYAAILDNSSMSGPRLIAEVQNGVVISHSILKSRPLDQKIADILAKSFGAGS